jgi:TIR domain
VPAPAEVFVSHSDQDRELVVELCGVLDRHGVPFWYARRDLLAAKIWHDEIGAALERCDWLLVVLSPASIDSMWVRREVQYALRSPRYDGRIVPILAEPCDFDRLSWTLRGFQMISFGEDPTKAYRQLLQIWGLGFRP